MMHVREDTSELYEGFPRKVVFGYYHEQAFKRRTENEDGNGYILAT